MKLPPAYRGEESKYLNQAFSFLKHLHFPLLEAPFSQPPRWILSYFFSRHNGNCDSSSFLLVYIDDLLITGNDDSAILTRQSFLSQPFHLMESSKTFLLSIDPFQERNLSKPRSP